jgi:WD40 repeat protein
MTKGLPKTALDVFVSYSRRDQVFVRTLINRLQDYNLVPWVDWDDIPLLSEWREEIRQGVISAHNFLFILSPDSLNSNECAKELDCAIANHKRLVPIICRDVTGLSVPPALADINWIPFLEPEGFEQSFQDLLKALKTDLDDIRVHTRLLQRSHEWAGQQCDRSFLLQGTALESVETWLAQKSDRFLVLNPLQRDFIAASRLAETRRQKIVLGSVVSALVLVAFLGLITEVRRRQAVASEIAALNSASAASLALKNPLEALILGLRANIRSSQATWIAEPLRVKTLSVLGQATYWVQELNRLEGHSGGVYGVAFSPDGELLASASLDGTLRLWHPDGHSVATSQVPSGGKLINVRFSPDGQMLATCGNQTPTQVWSRNGDLLHSFDEPDGVYGVDFSPDGEILATASLDQKVRLRRLDGTWSKELTGHPGPVLGVRFSPVDSTVVSASLDGTLKLWRADGTPLETFEAERHVYDVSFSPDGTLIASAGQDGVILWRPDGSQVKTLPTETDVPISLDFSADGQFIAAAGLDRVVYIWRLQDGALVTTLAGHQGNIWRVSFNPDGTLLASASEDLSVRIWQWDNPWMEQLRGHTDDVYSVALNAQTRQIVSGSKDGTVNLWTEQGRWVKTLPTATPWVNSVAVSPDGQWIAAAGTSSNTSEEGIVQLWTATGEDKGILARHGKWLSAVAFSADGQLLASAGNEGVVQIHTLTGDLQHSLELGSNALAVQFSPDGRWLAAAGDRFLKVWDLKTQSLRHAYERDTPINSLSFSPDSQTLIFANSDRTLGIWPLDTATPRLLQGHTGEVLAVQFSPDGRLFASAGRDQGIRLWDPAGNEIATIGSHEAAIKGLQFSADGSQLISASEDDTLILWNISLFDGKTLVQWGCQSLNGYLQNNPFAVSRDKTLCQQILKP